MTREEARDALWSNGHGDSNWIIAKIYNDHEAQLKAKDEEIEKLKLQLLNAHNDTGIPTYRVEK